MVDRVIELRGRGARGAIGIDIEGSPEGGEFLTFGAEPRKVYPSAGTGADAGLRTDLAGNNGGALVAYLPNRSGMRKRGVTSKLAENVSAMDFGAIADGTLHMLSERYASLAAAQAAYPVTTINSLDQSIDGVAVQAAMDWMESQSLRGAVYLPNGQYVLSDPIRQPSWMTIRGESQHGVVIYGAAGKHAIVNKDPIAYLNACLSNFTILGGDWGIYIQVSQETAGCKVEDIWMDQQTVGSQLWSSMQTTKHVRVTMIGDRDYGIDVTGFPCNANVFDAVRIGDVKRIPYRMRGYDSVTFTNGCSIENNARAPAIVTCSCNGTTLSVTAITGEQIEVGQLVIGDGIAPGTRITGNGSGGGGGGTYTVNLAQNFASRPAIISYPAIWADPGVSGTAIGLTIRDMYFENCPRCIMYAQDALGTSMHNCKLSFTAGSTLQNKIGGVFAGNGRVDFGTNVWEALTTGPINRTLTGVNNNFAHDIAFDPGLTVSQGAFVNASATGTYRDVAGGIRKFTVAITIVDNGTGAGVLTFGLPSAPVADGTAIGQETQMTGVLLGCKILNGSQTVTVAKYDGSYAGGNGYMLQISGEYKI